MFHSCRDGGRLIVCAPKTSHSIRVIALDRTTVTALRAHGNRQRAEAAAAGDAGATAGTWSQAQPAGRWPRTG